jgi:hypothetical protein
MEQTGRVQSQHHHILGRNPSDKRDNPCGLCGSVTRLTKTHVPPKCAGNDHLVYRRSLVVNNQIVRDGRALEGGLHVYGLCVDCNGIQSQYDNEYKKLKVTVQSCWVRGDLFVPKKIALPARPINPGAVARTVLIGMFGLDTRLRELFPETAEALLLQHDSVKLPRELRLYVALCRGVRARVSGSILWIDAARAVGQGGAQLGVHSRGQIYFPPLAWQLADLDPPPMPMEPLLDRQGWVDVSNWLLLDPRHEQDLNTLVPSLPAVTYPNWDPEHPAGGIELFPSDSTFLLECEDVTSTRQKVRRR